MLRNNSRLITLQLPAAILGSRLLCCSSGPLELRFSKPTHHGAYELTSPTHDCLPFWSRSKPRAKPKPERAHWDTRYREHHQQEVLARSSAKARRARLSRDTQMATMDRLAKPLRCGSSTLPYIESMNIKKTSKYTYQCRGRSSRCLWFCICRISCIAWWILFRPFCTNYDSGLELTERGKHSPPDWSQKACFCFPTSSLRSSPDHIPWRIMLVGSKQAKGSMSHRRKTQT